MDSLKNKKAPVETGAGLAYEKTCCKQPVRTGLLFICMANINNGYWKKCSYLILLLK
jgi:hypothetical protein